MPLASLYAEVDAGVGVSTSAPTAPRLINPVTKNSWLPLWHSICNFAQKQPRKAINDPLCLHCQNLLTINSIVIAVRIKLTLITADGTAQHSFPVANTNQLSIPMSLLKNNPVFTFQKLLLVIHITCRHV